MENLSVGNIVLLTAFVTELFTLIILVLTKTETILIAVEKIKGVIGLAYKDRAKRSDDEIRLFKKHEQVARERIKHSFVTMEKLDTKWVWNWNENFQPINIKGYCTGDYYKNNHYLCEYPVNFEITEGENNVHSIWLECSKSTDSDIHTQLRSVLELPSADYKYFRAEDVFEPIISKAILTERDLRIASEIKKIKKQFWR